jgi:hypothetical protein
MAKRYRCAYWALAGLNPGVNLSIRPWDYLDEAEQLGIVMALQSVLRVNPHEPRSH